MYYYHIWVRSDRYRGREALTYAYAEPLTAGTIVSVPLRSEQVLGFVVGSVTRPKFRLKAIARVLELPPLPATSLALAEWLRDYYGTPIGVAAGQVLPPKLPVAYQIPHSLPSFPPAKSHDLTWTDEQQTALATIAQPDTYLLHGRTGSGKTNIYLELTRRTLDYAKSALILSPEIGLSSHAAHLFRNVYGQRVVVLHSQLTARQRLTAWLQILTAKHPLIVIGPRSALFTPLASIGLIVIDEAHDSAYKQEQPPYYHAVRVAAQLRQLHQAALVLGSATPALTDYYLAQERVKPIIRLSRLAQAEKPGVARQVEIVDLKDRSQFSRSAHLSNGLITSIESSLASGEQALLYLNRRGTARVILCSVCGWQARCPRCDLPLTYHGDSFSLRCHTCGHSEPPVSSCPVCNNTSVVLKSFGTKAIAEEIQRLLPDARVARFDTDNSKAERLEQQHGRILNGAVDILVGTQMIAKGLDLPRLSTLGVIAADTSLYLPDYTAHERTYQLLTQVIGRVGRGHVSSRAIIQTYDPNSPLLQAALDDNWDSFYTEELAERRRYHFPPFYFLLKLSCRRVSSLAAERAANVFAEQLRDQRLPVEIDGPTPAFHEKIAGKYQWQIVVKARRRQHLLEIMTSLPAGWIYDIDPSDLL